MENVTGIAGILRAVGGDGGAAFGAGGAGGAGGAVQKITATVTRFAQAFIGGSGGNSGASTAGAAGGSVTDIKITGDIGNFAKAPNLAGTQFGIALNQMGGIFTGLGGTGLTTGSTGSVANVTATRIAAILAGKIGTTTASNLTTANAVAQISNVHATVFGADNANAGIFDFTDSTGAPNPNNGIFQLGDGDTALDGLVIVKNGGLVTAFSPAPLKLILA